MTQEIPNIVITRLAGGLGNQMFQYAAGRRMALAAGVPLKLDVTGYRPEGDDQAPGLEGFRRHVRITSFDIDADIASPEEISALRDKYHDRAWKSRIVRQVRRFQPNLLWSATHFRERSYLFDPAVLDLSPPAYLSGFWQSAKYFTDIESVVCRDFTPCDTSVLEYARKYVDGLRYSAYEPARIVSVHVRRGELAHARDVLKNSRGTFGPPTALNYIEQALSRFETGFRFLVFSDSQKDIDWCKQNIHAEFLSFSEGHDDIQDMMLMRECDDHVVASTFSWWAAWLNQRVGRRVIAPKQWGHAGGPMVPDDLIPSDWEMI